MLKLPMESIKETNMLSVGGDVIEKKKKGRPKKTVVESEKNIENDNNGEVEKKKRGRKKKKVDEVKVKKKRGRKAALKYFSSSIRKQISLKTNIVDNENNILFLDIQEDDDEIDNILNEKTNSFINLKDINDNIISDTLISSDTLHTLTDDTNNTLSVEKTSLDYVSINGHIEHDINSSNSLSFNAEFSKIISNENNINNCIIENFKQMSLTNLTNNISNISYNEENGIETSKTNTLLEDDIIAQKDNIKKGYFQMFNYFDNWMEKTNVKCWWCCHNFDTLPLGYPVKFDSKINKFRVKGIFCSFACMLAYAKNTKGIECKEYLIKYLYKKLTGCKYNEILYKEAPSRYTLKEFGGHLNIEQFRKLSNEHTFYKMIEYPMYESRDYIAEVDLLNIKQVNDKIFKNEKSNKIIIDDKKIQEVKQRIAKIDQNVSISNSIENFIKN